MMNKHEFKGNARYVTGKVEKAVGDAVDSRDWQVDGVVDQVAGSAEHAYGRAKSVAENAIDAAPALAEEARDRLKAAGDRAADLARKSGKAANASMGEAPALWALVAAVGGYAIAWAIHGRRA